MRFALRFWRLRRRRRTSRRSLCGKSPSLTLPLTPIPLRSPRKNPKEGLVPRLESDLNSGVITMRLQPMSLQPASARVKPSARDGRISLTLTRTPIQDLVSRGNLHPRKHHPPLHSQPPPAAAAAPRPALPAYRPSDRQRNDLAAILASSAGPHLRPLKPWRPRPRSQWLSHHDELRRSSRQLLFQHNGRKMSRRLRAIGMAMVRIRVGSRTRADGMAASGRRTRAGGMAASGRRTRADGMAGKRKAGMSMGALRGRRLRAMSSSRPHGGLGPLGHGWLRAKA